MSDDITGVGVDERLIMPDRGVGRDIGRRLDFNPHRPSTRSESRNLGQVGGYGRGEESITSMAQRYVTFTLPITTSRRTERYTLVEGPGAVSGINLAYYGSGAEYLCRVELVDGQSEQVLYRFGLYNTSLESSQVLHQFSDWGVQFNRLILRTTTEYVGSNQGGEMYLNQGTVYLSSVE